jgi:hypothetical protein
LQPQDEYEILVELIAPSAPGMYTTYFKAQTGNEQNFGHRLWATILVDPEVQTTVVSSEVQQAETTAVVDSDEWITISADITAEVKSNSTNEVVIDPVVTIKTSVLEEEVSVIAPVTVPVPTTVEIVAPPQPPVTIPTNPVVVPVKKPNPLEILWRKELEVLAEMGFDDAIVALPHLQNFLGNPVSLSGDRNAVPNAEGMQNVIASLLGM